MEIKDRYGAALQATRIRDTDGWEVIAHLSGRRAGAIYLDARRSIITSESARQLSARLIELADKIEGKTDPREFAPVPDLGEEPGPTAEVSDR